MPDLSKAGIVVQEPSGIHLPPHDLSLWNQRPIIEIVPFAGLQTGRIEAEARSLGTGIASVKFELDGKEVARRVEPPWTVELKLGQEPRPHTLRVLASDLSGAQVASDELKINGGSHRFRLRLLEPVSNESTTGATTARAVVEVPASASLERVDFFLAEDEVASVYQSPFVHRIDLPPNSAPTYIRAKAVLTDGRTSEDLVLLNMTGEIDEIEVREVELFATIFDRRRRPISDLTRKEIQISEEGVEQKINRFERVLDLPVHLSLVIDSSSSMEEELPLFISSTVKFFNSILKPEDQTAVVTFDVRTSLAVPFTRDRSWLESGVAFLSARGGTALWDGLVGTLNYFGGLEGKRAMILVSDGDDQHSRFSYKNTLSFAERAGVAVYVLFPRFSGLHWHPNALDDGAGNSHLRFNRKVQSFKESDVRRKRLQNLAEETGGLFFEVANEEQLDVAFDAIENDLRSQYLVTYQSEPSGDGFRKIRLEVSRRGARIRAPNGYYP